MGTMTARGPAVARPLAGHGPHLGVLPSCFRRYLSQDPSDWTRIISYYTTKPLETFNGGDTKAVIIAVLSRYHKNIVF